MVFPYYPYDSSTPMMTKLISSHSGLCLFTLVLLYQQPNVSTAMALKGIVMNYWKRYKSPNSLQIRSPDGRSLFSSQQLLFNRMYVWGC